MGNTILGITADTAELDSTVLIEWLRGSEAVAVTMLGLLSQGDTPATSSVNLAEIEAGPRQPERPKAEMWARARRYMQHRIGHAWADGYAKRRVSVRRASQPVATMSHARYGRRRKRSAPVTR